MKKNQRRNGDEEHDSEILKAVAQAWHAHSISSKAMTISESDAHRRFFKGKPTRFKLEATNVNRTRPHDQCWDFRQSLWDSYEIVSVSKKLETGLLMGDPFSAMNAVRRRRESSHSLRSLFNRMSSRRFSEDDELASQQD
ncbi:hypothetical protein ACS0TY_034901 [Phlomoides rotata]